MLRVLSRMGRRRKKQQYNAPRRDKGYSDIVKENKRYEEYYKAQKCIPEAEFDDFIAAMKVPLPAVFRITGHKDHAKQLLKKMKENHFSEIVDVKLDKDEVKMPNPLPWYPDDLAWQTNLSRTQIRKVPELEKFHNFLITETESGHITRQESVSMIPPLLLDVKPHHKILDLCAAPGSKTAQLIEMLHRDESNEGLSKGLCIANDKDNKRCYMLVHQTNRLNSPVSLVVNHDGARFPNLMLKDENGFDYPLKYDRVLADVPCSGDGTMRKNTDVWLKWNVGNGLYLHGLQVRILQRGLELLETGGKIVYSTCSLNPVEDEAVVGALLSKCDGAVELIDVMNDLKGLKWCPGIQKWRVLDRSGTWYENYSEVPENKRQIRPTMFPPENPEKYNFERCMRLLPHYQDTGGFFVAVLVKKRPLPWEKTMVKRVKDCESTQNPSGVMDEENALEKDSAEVSTVDDSSTATESRDSPPAKKKRWGDGYKEDPFVFFNENDADIVSQVKSFYSLKDSFPSDQLLTRTTAGKKRHIYMVSSLVRNIITNNTGRLKLINTGVRVFSRCDNSQPNLKCAFRVVQDGSEVVEPFMQSRVVMTGIDDAIVLLLQEQPSYDDLSKGLQEQLKDLDAGSMLFKYVPQSKELSVACNLIMSGWKGRKSARLYMSKYERAHFLNLIGHEVPEEYRPNTNTRRKRAENTGDDSKNGANADTENCREAENPPLPDDIKKDAVGDEENAIEN